MTLRINFFQGRLANMSAERGVQAGPAETGPVAYKPFLCHEISIEIYFCDLGMMTHTV